MILLRLAQFVDRVVSRRAVAAAGNMLLRWRVSDPRRFAVDASNRWINRQPEATFVSPDIYTTHFHQVRTAVLDYWCQLYTPRAGDTVIDVGAGIGEEAVIFSKVVGPSGRVVSIEAHPGTFGCLQETVRRSGLTNVLPVHCAVADEDGKIIISDSMQHLANSVIGGTSGVEVPARSLDSLLDQLGVSRIDLLKMNIEGAELAAVAGMRRIAAATANVAISCHDFVAESTGNDRFRTIANVEPQLKSLGYAVHRRLDAPHPWLRDTLYGRRVER